MIYIRIRNFDRFQHYKQRNPPWIRIYRSLWHDCDFFRLPDTCKAHVIGLISLASQHENKIRLDEEWIAREISATEKIDIKALIESRFIEAIDDADSVISVTPVTSQSVISVTEMNLGKINSFVRSNQHEEIAPKAYEHREMNLPELCHASSSASKLLASCYSEERRGEERVLSSQISNTLGELNTSCNAYSGDLNEKRGNITFGQKRKKRVLAQLDFSGKNQNGNFGKFWEAYPRKEAKLPAMKAWAKIEADEQLLEKILAWLSKARLSEQWQDKRMIPHPATWLNQRRWEGDPPPEPVTEYERMFGHKEGE